MADAYGAIFTHHDDGGSHYDDITPVVIITGVNRLPGVAVVVTAPHYSAGAHHKYACGFNAVITPVKGCAATRASRTTPSTNGAIGRKPLTGCKVVVANEASAAIRPQVAAGKPTSIPRSRTAYTRWVDGKPVAVDIIANGVVTPKKIARSAIPESSVEVCSGRKANRADGKERSTIAALVYKTIVAVCVCAVAVCITGIGNALNVFCGAPYYREPGLAAICGIAQLTAEQGHITNQRREPHGSENVRIYRYADVVGRKYLPNRNHAGPRLLCRAS